MTRSWAGTAASQQASSAATARRSPGLRERAPLAAAVTQRMDLLFTKYPKIKESYDIVNKLRAIFRSTSLDREAARVKLHGWYKAVNRCTIREIKSARDAIKSREDKVLNYFIERSTNASAESLNSKMKGFRARLRGVSDLPFFMYRLCMIFG